MTTDYNPDLERLEAELDALPEEDDSVLVQADNAIVKAKTDLDELEEFLADAERRVKEKSQLEQKQARLKRLMHSKSPDHELERQQLLASIRRLEEGIVWQTTANVALFYAQTCTMCGGRHRFFAGWMTEQLHKTDPNSRRLLAGRAIESLPSRLEIYEQPPVDICSNCAESSIAIDNAVREAV